MSTVTILIPAAGASRRMRGADKLLQQVGGEALLRRQVQAALATGAPVLVTLAELDGPRALCLAGLQGLTILPVAGAAEGMAASLRAGAAAAGGSEGLMILLPDMPDIGTVDLRALLDAFTEAPNRVLRAATEDGIPGHPVLIPRRLFAAMAGLKGDAGARSLLAGETPRLLPLQGERAITDLDTPEGWAAWRARNAGQGLE